MVPVEGDYGNDADAWSLWRMWQGSTLAGGWIADVEIRLLPQDEEAVAGAVYNNGFCNSVTEDGPYLLTIRGSGHVAEALSSLFDDGERRLASVMVEDERVGGSATVPRLADSTAAEHIFGWQPGKDLIDDKSLGQVVEDGHADKKKKMQTLVRHT